MAPGFGTAEELAATKATADYWADRHTPLTPARRGPSGAEVRVIGTFGAESA